MDTTPRLPALFLSHGSPMLAIEDSPAGRFLDGLAHAFPRPDAIVVASAHFMATRPLVGGAASPDTVHDFGGFAPALHAIRYPAPGAPALAARIRDRLDAAGIEAAVRPSHGLDHGVWVPLRRMYPDADIPVVPLAVMPGEDAARHLEIGRALAPLRDEGVLVIGSGGFIHNLGDLDFSRPDAEVPDWAQAFGDWMRGRIATRDWRALVEWQARAPHARRAHPTPEHLLPLFVALGAAGAEPGARLLHGSVEFGSLALDAYAFE